MIASDPTRTLFTSCKPGAVHIWVPAFAGTTVSNAERPYANPPFSLSGVNGA
jgi:hypothetical protein